VANGRKGHNWSGVYVFRGRRPGLIGRIPYPLFPVLVIGALLFCHLKGLPLWLAGFSVLLSPRHTMYVGEGHVRSRYRDHLDGSVKFNALPKPWADLKPSWYFIPLPYVKPILHTAETLLMLALWPGLQPPEESLESAAHPAEDREAATGSARSDRMELQLPAGTRDALDSGRRAHDRQPRMGDVLMTFSGLNNPDWVVLPHCPAPNHHSLNAARGRYGRPQCICRKVCARCGCARSTKGSG
jgi:hypothetical protein